MPSHARISNAVPRLWKWPFAPMTLIGWPLLIWQVPENVGVVFDFQTRIDCFVAKSVPISCWTCSFGIVWKLTFTSPPSGVACEVAFT